VVRKAYWYIQLVMKEGTSLQLNISRTGLGVQWYFDLNEACLQGSRSATANAHAAANEAPMQSFMVDNENY
jgi:hypothetical protein